MLSITREISATMVENASIRARNLFESSSDCLRDLNATLYLDIGTHLGYNALIFGANVNITIGIDLDLPADNILRKSPRAHLLVGDGMNLPFGEGTFDIVSLFSVLEHVPNAKLLLREVFHAIKSKGVIIIQIPNRFFLVDLHSGLPLFFYIPSRLRNFIIKGTEYEWLKTINVPSIKQLVKLIHSIESRTQIIVRKVKYSPSIISPRFRAIYRLLSRIGLLDILPIGYIVIVRKS
jgi:SAM-dependent methyltransferase